MKRQTGRRIPPADLVPHGTPIGPRPRDGRERVLRRRRTRRYVGATIIVGTMMPMAAMVSYHFVFVAISLLLAMIMTEYATYGAIDARTRAQEGRQPMIQDMFNGIFGQAGVAASTGPTPPVAAGPVVEELPAPVPTTRASDNPKIPGVARPVVVEIEGKIDRILGAIGRHELGDMTPREMTDLRDVHLPALISSYVGIPADHRARIFEEKKKSASYVLKDSLDVISADLDETIARLAQREISSFDDANRFIADRYGKRKDPFQ